MHVHKLHIPVCIDCIVFSACQGRGTSGAAAAPLCRNQWRFLFLRAAWAFLVGSISSLPFFYRLQIGVAFFAWASFDHRRRDQRRTESSWARQISFSSDLTKLRLSPVATDERRTDKRNGRRRRRATAKRLWRFVAGVKAAARDLGPSTLHARTAP